MAEMFDLSVLASDKTFYVGKCSSLVIPTSSGLAGILAHHRNMIAAIVPGTMKYTDSDGAEHIAAVSNGMIKVEDGNVLVLADTAERPEEIDINRAKRDAEQAKEAILQKKSIRDYRSAQARMARALSRIAVGDLSRMN